MDKKLVVITGVTRGLGHAFVGEFTKRGWKIAGCGRSSQMIQHLQKEYGEGNSFSVIDITDDAAVAKWANDISINLGIPNILINNAGLINQPSNLWEISSAEFSDIINTNVIGAVNMIRHFTPLMIKQAKGLIVNVSSGWGLQGEALFAPYCASKFAIEAITQSLAAELPKGLTVVSLDPGAINTDMLYKAYQEEAKSFPTAEQRAKMIVPFLLNITSKENGKHLVAPLR